MNLDQYRAIKAEEQKSTQASEQNLTVQPTTVVTPEPQVTTETVPETQPTAAPAKVVVNGIGEVDIEELKSGYLRQSDYTRKTQEISAKSKENEDALALYQYLRQNPQLAQQMLANSNVPQNLNPANSKIEELEEKYYDLMLQNDIRNMQDKYKDFDTEKVLRIADSKGITNLEDAYLIFKATAHNEATPSNVEDIKKQLREELIKELALEQKSTQTLISPSAQPIVQNQLPSLSAKEHNVASNMGMTDAEYIKWRDVDRRK